jgi:O-antigen ligase
MTLANPLLGSGLNTFVHTMEPFDPKDVMEYFPAPAHNLYLLESAEAGLPALALWLALFGSTLAIAVTRLGRLGDRASRWLAAALCAGVAGFLVSQLADFSHRLEPLRSLVWVAMGLLFGVLRLGRESRLAARGAAPAAPPAGA